MKKERLVSKLTGSSRQSDLHFNAALFAVITDSQLPLIKVEDIQVEVPPTQGWWPVSNE